MVIGLHGCVTPRDTLTTCNLDAHKTDSIESYHPQMLYHML